MANTLIDSLNMFLTFIRALIIVRIVLSWLTMGRGGPFTNFIYNLTEPLLSPIRKMIEKSPLGGPGMMLDLSPLILLIFLQIIGPVLTNLIRAIF